MLYHTEKITDQHKILKTFYSIIFIDILKVKVLLRK